jgi:tripartite-type tricarboxylate transporter receptor subunit TctC
MRAPTILTLALAALFGAGTACAQGSAASKPAQATGDYPNRPVRWVVPFAPGASNDIIARLIAQKFAETWSQQFVIDNRGGVGGAIGAEIVARAAPDGYTLLSANPGPSVNNIVLRLKPTYAFSDFEPVIFLGYAPLLILAHPAFAPKTAKELVDHLRANPNKVAWGSSGFGSSLHIGLELFLHATGTKATHVPYKGTAPALTDVLGGQIQLMHTTTVSAEQQIKSGRVRVLAIAAKKRQAVLPDVPTLAEQGINNAEALVWFGLMAPAKTSRTIIQKLNAEGNRALGLPDVKARLDQLGLEVGGGSPEEFASFIRTEVDKLRALIKAGSLKPE